MLGIFHLYPRTKIILVNSGEFERLTGVFRVGVVYSTEVVLTLHTQQPRVRIPATTWFVDSIETPSGAYGRGFANAVSGKGLC